MGKVTSVVILASGNAMPGVVEWKSAEHPLKVLLPIGGVPLVLRTLRQLKQIGVKAIVASAFPEVKKVIPESALCTPKRSEMYMDTALSTFYLWKHAERVVFLNGDVIWHPDVLAFVMGSGEPLAIYGDSQGQVYGWAFDMKCLPAVMMATLGTNSYSQIHFFRRLCGCSQLRDADIFRPVVPAGTYTRDIDLFKDYEAWLNNHPDVT